MRSRRTLTESRPTRREWTVLLGVAPLAANAAQIPAIVPAAPPSFAPKAIEDVRQVSDKLSKLEVPMNVEPAFSFKA